jgi:hypothetical protein
LKSWGAILVTTFFCPLLAAQPTQPQVPVQTELVKVLDVSRAQNGDTFLARTTIEWKSNNCNLRKGAILQGHVVSESTRSKTSPSELALMFDSAQCDGQDMKPFPLTVAALLAPVHNRNSSLYGEEQSQPLSDAVGLSLNGGMRSLQTAADTVFNEPPRAKPVKAVMPGQVIGLGSLKLSIATGPDASSVLSDAKRNIRLEAATQFVLVPTLGSVVSASVAPASTNAKAAAASPATTPPASVKAVDEESLTDETSLCAPPDCSIALNEPQLDKTAIKPSSAISIADFGYRPRVNHEFNRFDYDAAIAYLGPTQLLFTFNPHKLVPRPEREALPTLRTVRAVLIDLGSMRAVRTLDWRVPDANQYLWPVGQTHVVVHVGRELRLYGPGLKIEQRYSLGGPLAFVQTSPANNYFAVGILRERHTPGIHRQLLEAENREPEEDVELKILDSDFHTRATIVRSSRNAPPVLTELGELQISGSGKSHWRLAERTWDGQTRAVGTLASSCRPDIASMASKLLFVVGCDRTTSARWYRVLRLSGRPLLKGAGSTADLTQTASWSADNGTFAIGVATASKSVLPDEVFRVTDIDHQQIDVYQPDKGQRLFDITVASPLPTFQTFVLSPEGKQLAVLHSDQIDLYSVPAANSPAK